MNSLDIENIIRCYNKVRSRGLKEKEKCLTYEDKIKWISIFDCNDLKIYCADKLNVRSYVKEKIGKDISVPIIKVYDNVNQIEKSELPDSFVIKCNHGSGWNIIVKDKEKIEFEFIKSKVKRWLSMDYSKNCGELHYHWIKPLAFSEKYLADVIYDYRFYCFNGQPIFMDVVNRSSEKFYNTYDLDFNPIPGMRIEKTNYNAVKKPNSLDIMLEYARILCKDFKFVRVDFFYLDDIIYLSELTFTPAAGSHRFNDKYNKELGQKLII